MLKIFPEKLQSRLLGPFEVTNVHHHGTVETKFKRTDKTLKVNGHRLKVLYESDLVSSIEQLELEDPRA